ncbi:hypothetical protein JCM10212_005037 [Sporobolomyces blumeae]
MTGPYDIMGGELFESTYRLLATLRIALPAALLGTVLLGWLIRVCLAVKDREIESEGWTLERALFGSESDDAGSLPTQQVPSSAGGTIGATANGADDADVVAMKKTRNRFVFLTVGIIATTYLFDGVAQVVGGFVRHQDTSSIPLYWNLRLYAVGALLAMCVLGAGLAYEATLGRNGVDGLGGVVARYHPGAVGSVGLALDLACLVVYSRLLVLNAQARSDDVALAFSHLAVLCLRIVAYGLLVLVPTPVLDRIAHGRDDGNASERVPLLASGTPNTYSS